MKIEAEIKTPNFAQFESAKAGIIPGICTIWIGIRNEVNCCENLEWIFSKNLWYDVGKILRKLRVNI